MAHRTPLDWTPHFVSGLCLFQGSPQEVVNVFCVLAAVACLDSEARCRSLMQDSPCGTQTPWWPVCPFLSSSPPPPSPLSFLPPLSRLLLLLKLSDCRQTSIHLHLHHQHLHHTAVLFDRRRHQLCETAQQFSGLCLIAACTPPRICWIMIIIESDSAVGIDFHRQVRPKNYSSSRRRPAVPRRPAAWPGNAGPGVNNTARYIHTYIHIYMYMYMYMYIYIYMYM